MLALSVIVYDPSFFFPAHEITPSRSDNTCNSGQFSGDEYTEALHAPLSSRGSGLPKNLKDDMKLYVLVCVIYDEMTISQC